MELDLHITNKCNLKCKHCVYASGELEMPDISLKTIRRLSSEFQDMGIKEIHLTGGEPLINLDIYNIISYLHNCKFIIKMQSNGILIDDVVASKLKNCGLSQILISIDGQKTYHNELRGFNNSFESAINAVELCIKNNISTRVNTVISRDNIKDISKLIAYLAEYDIDQHSFFYFTPIGRGKLLKKSVLSFEEWKEIKESIIDYASKYNVLNKIRIQDVFYEDNQFIMGDSICRKDNCLILSNGDVFHCVFFIYSEYKLGNIYQNNLLDIWGNFHNVMSKINLNRLKRCSNTNCGGGCPGMALLIGDNIDKCDVRCRPDLNLISGCIRKYITVNTLL